MQNDEPKAPARVTVAGIGSSAGGLDALRRFFAVVPPDLGLAYVVVSHLSPDHESELSGILSHGTKMSVVEVGDSEHLQLTPNCIYVMAPDRKLEITENTVAAAPFTDVRERRAAIDVFLRSLAANHGGGFAILLSGGGSDGAIGARAVKEAGGVVLVQDPHEATHDAMPRAVIDANVADVVLPIEQLAARLVELVQQRETIVPLIRGQPVVGAADEVSLKRIFELLRLRTGHDFSRYKRPTILRRLARRMQLGHRSSFEHYLALLREQPEEIQSLFDDLLISVTSFFRDPATWEALRTQVVAPVVEKCQGEEPIRVWVPGCATGEEVYTLAILFREEIARRDVACDLVIFGSDVDEAALATARDGCYSLAVGADVSETRLARYFRAEGEQYRVTNEIRDCAVFAAHSVLRDPPFSKLHLISCRNLLIYLDRDLQQQLQNVFRYGLRDDGYLLIGVSETADPELFEPIDKHHRIFRTRPRALGPPVRLPQLPDVQYTQPVERVRDRAARARRSASESHAETLEEVAPPSVLIDEHWNVEHLSDGAGRYLQPRGGPPSQTLMDLVRTELVDELRAALHRAFETRDNCLSTFVPVRFNGHSRLVALLVQPRPPVDGRTHHVLVTFLEAGDVAPSDDAGADDGSSDAKMLEMRDKLRIAEQRLESMRQEHSLAYEDLRAANEELQSLNEEYRSTTEELETSKEELQSVNEELQTVNNELKMKLEEVSRANNDLENFMAATDIPMLFLDRSLAIKRYTAPLRQIFNVKTHDQGRPIGDLTHGLIYEELERDAARVLADLQPIEREVRSRDGAKVTVRLRPYRTSQDKIDGVVITFGS